MAEMQNAADAVIDALCKDDHNPHVQARAAEESSRRAPKREQATTQNAHDAAKATALTQAAIQRPLDTQDIASLLEQGASMEVMLRAARRWSVPKLKPKLASRIEWFCRCASQEAEHPDFYEAGNALRHYFQGQITDQELRTSSIRTLSGCMTTPFTMGHGQDLCKS